MENKTDTRSNYQETVTLDVPVTLLVALEHAMLIAHNTSVMCHEKRSAEGFKKLGQIIRDLAPTCASHFDRGNWSEMLLAASEGTDFTFGVQKSFHFKKEFLITVTGPENFEFPKSVFGARNICKSETFESEEEAKSVAKLAHEYCKALKPMPE